MAQEAVPNVEPVWDPVKYIAYDAVYDDDAHEALIEEDAMLDISELLAQEAVPNIDDVPLNVLPFTTFVAHEDVIAYVLPMTKPAAGGGKML